MSDTDISHLQTQFRFNAAQFEQHLRQLENYKSVEDVERDYVRLTQLATQAQIIAQSIKSVEPIERIITLSETISKFSAPTVESSVPLHRAFVAFSRLALAAYTIDQDKNHIVTAIQCLEIAASWLPDNQPYQVAARGYVYITMANYFVIVDSMESFDLAMEKAISQFQKTGWWLMVKRLQFERWLQHSPIAMQLLFYPVSASLAWITRNHRPLERLS